MKPRCPLPPLVLCLLAGLALAAPAAADVHPNTAPGFPVEQAFHVGGFDNVNLFNGALTLTLPLGGSYPVNGGFSYGLKLVYNSNPWDYLYTPASAATLARANVAVRRRNSGSKTAAILAVNQVIADFFGRLYQEQRRLPGGLFNKRETLYDGAGNKASVSELTTGAATSRTSFLGYDPFGRPTTLRPPDGAVHDVTLAYQGQRQTARTVKIATAVGSETAATTTEVYDRHGRLRSVTEPSGDAGANVTTTYGYDVGNRLVSVSTPAFVPGAGTVTQTRSFSYDRAGLLQSEAHPELGAAGNGAISYPWSGRPAAPSAP